MPIYNFRCNFCKREYESIAPLGLEIIPCKFCEGEAIRQFTPTRFIPFRSFTDFDMTGEPIEIGSPQQFSKELHKRGLEITDRPLRHKRKRKGMSDLAKKMFCEKIGKEIADASA